MRIDHRITDFFLMELIIGYDCGCAFLYRTREQVAFCSNCPIQLELPYEN